MRAGSLVVLGMVALGQLAVPRAAAAGPSAAPAASGRVSSSDESKKPRRVSPTPRAKDLIGKRGATAGPTPKARGLLEKRVAAKRKSGRVAADLQRRATVRVAGSAVRGDAHSGGGGGGGGASVTLGTGTSTAPDIGPTSIPMQIVLHVLLCFWATSVSGLLGDALSLFFKDQLRFFLPQSMLEGPGFATASGIFKVALRAFLFATVLRSLVQVVLQLVSADPSKYLKVNAVELEAEGEGDEGDEARELDEDGADDG